MIYIEAYFLFLVAWLVIWWLLRGLNILTPVGMLAVSAIWFYFRLPALPDASSVVLAAVWGTLGLTTAAIGNAVYCWHARETNPKDRHTMGRAYRVLVAANIGIGSLAIAVGAGAVLLIH